MSDDVDGIAGAALVGLAGARDGWSARGSNLARPPRAAPEMLGPLLPEPFADDEPPELEFGVPVADSSTSSLNV